MAVFCTTTLNYIPGGEGAPGRRQASTVDILDGRGAALPGWQDCGFELIAHSSAITDWEDDGAIASIHYPEVESLARAMTGADHALVSTHIKRSPRTAERQTQLSPITFVHSDFADSHVDIIRRSYRNAQPGSQAALDRNGLTADAVEEARRIVILQFWRNLGPAKMDHPLAFCDARTVALEQARPFRVTNYAGTGATFDALGVTTPAEGSPPHRWYTFPELRPDEAVAFRTYDTDLVREGAVYFTPHSAFRDPDVEVGRPARSSIELRATCLYV